MHNIFKLNILTSIITSLSSKHMGLNPLSLNWLYSYHNLQCIKLDKERIYEKKSVLCIQKTFNTILKMGSIPFWVQFHVYLFLYTLPDIQTLQDKQKYQT